MTINEFITAFSNIKTNYIRPLSHCSKTDQGDIVCNDNFTAFSLEKIKEKWIKLHSCVADDLWFDNVHGVIIVEFKNGNLDGDEKRRLRLQALESILIILPEIMMKCGIEVKMKDICDLREIFIVVYNIDHYSELKSNKIARHLKALSLFNLSHLEKTVYDKVLPYDKEEFIEVLENFKGQKACPA